VAAVAQGNVPCSELVVLAEKRQVLSNWVAVLDANQNGALTGLLYALHIVRRRPQLGPVGMHPREPVDGFEPRSRGFGRLAIGILVESSLAYVDCQENRIHSSFGHLHEIALESGVAAARVQRRRGVLGAWYIDVGVDGNGPRVDGHGLLDELLFGQQPLLAGGHRHQKQYGGSESQPSFHHSSDPPGA
jgi:hypothetical protein